MMTRKEIVQKILRPLVDKLFIFGLALSVLDYAIELHYEKEVERIKLEKEIKCPYGEEETE